MPDKNLENHPIEGTPFRRDPDSNGRIQHPREQSLYRHATRDLQDGLKKSTEDKESLAKALQGLAFI